MLKVLLTGGGTGGHIYPALATARRLKELSDDVSILYIGTHRGLESKIVPEAGLDFKTIQIEGFKRELSWDGLKYNLNTIKLLLKSLKDAKNIIKDFRPDIVLGTGGYVAGPVCLAASRLNIPTIIHEQNSVVGLTNKLLAYFVDKIAICFDNVYEQLPKFKEKIVFTGNPRAQEIAQLKPSKKDLFELGLDADRPTILIAGGSRGAEAINQAVTELAPELAQASFQTIFVTGEVHYKNIKQSLNKETQNNSFVLVPYLPNLIDILSQVDLMISRSGATTIAELTALGKPSILIPSPYVTANHQMINAQSLVDSGAALMIEESNLNAEKLGKEINKLMNNPQLLEEMSQSAQSLGHPKAADHLIQVMMDLVERGE